MPVRPGFYIEPHFSVRSESDGIAKNERQLWVLHHSRTGTAKKTGLNPVFFAGEP